MKTTHILLLIVLLISCESKNPNEFTLNVKINGNYSGYLYLTYNQIKDSSLVKDGQAFFMGSVEVPTMANFATSLGGANDKNFYLENCKITSEITLTTKKLSDFTIDWIIIDEISGTKTSVIRKDYDEFKTMNSSNENWNIKLYDKLKQIFKQYPKHRYSGDLLSEVSYDTILSNKQIRELYLMLDTKSQDSFIAKKLNSKIFPERIIKVGDLIFDFRLPNTENELLSTESFRGQILFIDFWASWCKPCREQFPELKQINADFKERGLTVIGVSIDEKEKDWYKALDKDQLNWDNVIDTTGIYGMLCEKYGIFGIPYNILVDENGKVIATDIKLEQLRITLDSILKKKTIANNV